MVNKTRFSISAYPNNLVVGTTLVCAFLSFLHIGRKSVWLDEAASIHFAQLPWGDFWRVLFISELNQGLYYFLLRFWLIFGDSEVAVRSLSAFFAIASIPLLYALANRLFGVRAGIISALLVSVNAFFVQYAQEARGYSLLFFIAALSTYLFVRLTEDASNKKILCAYACVGALAVYAHFFGAFVLVAHALSVPFLPWDRFRFRRLVLANLLIAVLLVPLALFILLKSRGQVAWLTQSSLPSVKVLLSELTGDAGHSGFIAGFYVLSCVVALAHAFVALLRTGRSIETWRYAVVVLWLAVPVCLSYGFSFFRAFYVRYLMVGLPALVLLSGVGIALIKDRYCSTALVALLMILSVRSTWIDYYPRENHNFRDTVSYVIARAQRGDGILFYKEFTLAPFEYYWKRLKPSLSYPESVHSSPLGQFNWLRDSRELSVAYIGSLKDRYERIWIVQSHIFGERRIMLNSILTTIGEHYQLLEEKSYEGVHVSLFVKK